MISKDSGSCSPRITPMSEDIKPLIPPPLVPTSPTTAKSKSPRKPPASPRKGAKAAYGLKSAIPDVRATGLKKTGGWSKAEVRALFDALELIPGKVHWDDVASKVSGRDKLSCSNKWRYDVLPKLQAFIDSLGEEK